MGKKRGAPAQTHTQTTAPWAEQIPHLRNTFNRAEGLYNGPQREFFPGQTYANFAPETNQALDLTAARAMQGNPLLESSKAYTQGILNSDPEVINKVLGANLADIIPALQSQYALAGMGRSNLARGAEQSAISREAVKLMESAANRAPGLDQASAMLDYQNLAKLAGVGESRQDQAQKGIEEAMNRHEFAQEAPYKRLEDFMRFIRGTYGEDKTTFTPAGPGANRLSGILGGGMGGAAQGAAFGGLPGGIAGGILGGMGGFF